VGGDFQTVAGETQPYLAAIDVATGRLDQNWRPQLNGLVYSIAVSPDGSAVYVGGKFNKIDNKYPNRIAKLDPITGAVDTNFDPDADAAVESIVTDGTNIWAGGSFTTIGGVAQNNLAKLDSSGVVDTSFDPALNGKVLDIELFGSSLYIAGNFTTIDGATHKRLADLDPTTGVAQVWPAESNFKVYDISVKPDGTMVYAAGAGSLGAGGNSLEAWDTTTGQQMWRRVNSGDFQAVVATDDLVYIGTHGEYVYIDNDGIKLEDDDNPNAIRRNKLAAFDPVTGALDAWNPGANSVWGVWSLSLGPSGLLVGGDFITIGGVVQPHFAVFPGPSVGNESPIPTFTYDCDNAGNCAFDATGSSDPDGSISNYAWDFGNGQTASGSTASASFDADDRSTVALTVTDNGGLTARTQNVILVGDGLLGVELVGTATANGQATSTVTLPTAISTDDVALAIVSVGNETSAINAPAGWTLVGARTSGSMKSAVFTKPLSGADAGASVSFTFDNASYKSATKVLVLRNVDPAAPVQAFASAGESNLWAQHTAPAVNAAQPGVVVHYWADRSGSGEAIAAPGDEAVVATTTGVGGGHITATTSIATDSLPGAVPARVAIGEVQTTTALGWSIALTYKAPPPPAPQSCTATLNADDSISLTWDSIAGEDSYSVRRNGSYLASTGNALSYTDDPGVGTWDYVIRSKDDGVTTNTSCGAPVTINTPPPATQTCSAVLNADDTITVSWDAIPGENSYGVRRNGTYLASAGNALSYTDDPGVGTWDYVIRSKDGGVTTNTSCGASITINTPPPATQTCSAVLNANNSVTLAWTAIAGEDDYSVRRNGSWRATAGNVLTFTETPGGGTWDYGIRSRTGGVTTNTSCGIVTVTGNPPAGQTCSATVNADGSVSLSWTAIAGENSYSVRRNDAWLDNTGALTFTDAFAQAGDTYVIRSKLGGVTTNTSCA